MIKYSGNTIYDWNFGDDNIVKVYKNNAVCYYKLVISGGTTSQTPCFAVVNDISQYQETEFEDVYNKADSKWYKLNNLNQYEEYGVYGSGRTITTYEGKLTIDEESSSRLPSGYTEVEYIRQNSSYNAYIDTGVKPYGSVGNSFEVSATMKAYYKNTTCDTFLSCEDVKSPYFGFGYRFVCAGGSNYQIFGSDNNTATTVTNNSDGTFTYVCSRSNVTTTYNMPISLFCGYSNSSYTTPNRFSDIEVHSMSITLNNEIVRNYVPAKRDSDNKYGLYDLVTDTFYVSPNGNNFVGGSEVNQPTTCEFMYSGETWVNLGEVSGSTATLPNKSFVLNYNAKDYDGTTHTIAKTNGQTKDVDAVCNYGYHIVDHSADGYITVTGNTRMLLSGTTYMGRNNTETGCTMTIVSKVKTNENYSILANRGANNTTQMNWMWRYPTNGIFLHGSSNYNSVTYSVNTTTAPIIASVKTYYDGGVKQTINDWTNNGSYNGNFAYGTEYNGNSSLFCDYASYNGEFWKGDFYWVYMSQEVLSDEEIQQVIAYNEGGGGTPTYPLYYTVIQDPPNNLSFSSMTEAEEYECPWVGMEATIDGITYIFSGDSISGYEWVMTSRLPSGYTEVEYVQNTTQAYINTNLQVYSSKTNSYEVEVKVIAAKHDSTTYQNVFSCMSEDSEPYQGFTYRYRSNTLSGETFPTGQNTFTVVNNADSTQNVTVTSSSSQRTYTHTYPLTLFCGLNSSRNPFRWTNSKFYSCKVTMNGVLIMDLVPCIRDNDSMVGMYDIVGNSFYYPPNYTSYQLVAGSIV